MKKTIQINLAGTVFHIDDDAYDHLRDYLTAIERQFSSASGGAEIINDLEVRMAELFTQRLQQHRQVISSEDVREVLGQLGEPYDLGGSRPSFNQRRGYGYGQQRRARRMYRDPDDKPIGGVCSGLAYYFNTDPLLMRILFVISLFMGFGFLLYIILWIALPLAQTTEQINEMRAGSNHF